MKQLGALFICLMLASCGPTGSPAGSSPGDLATSPPGGLYYGQGKLEMDTCDNPAEDSGAFDPFVLNIELHPENEDQSKLRMVAGEVIIEHIAPQKENAHYYIINHEVVSDQGYVYTFKLNGAINLGEMNLNFYEALHVGTVEEPGEIYCDASYQLHLVKIVNYPYVSAPILAPTEKTLKLILPPLVQ